MTINIAVKCPDGIVLGADSMFTITRASGLPPLVSALAPQHNKLFQLSTLPVGVLLNGDTTINGQIVEDVVSEYSETLDEVVRTQRFSVLTLADGLREFVSEKVGDANRQRMQLIVAGFSRNEKAFRYGEIYTITWADVPEGEVEPVYDSDAEHGAVFGGRPDPIYRFLYGFDRPTLLQMNDHWADVYDKVKEYIFENLAANGVEVPDAVRDIPLPPIRRVHPWELLSACDIQEIDSASRLLEAVREGSIVKYEPIYAFFSLRMAVNFAWHMLMIANTESNFLLQLPFVGSEFHIATITRARGLQYVWAGSAELPGLANR